MAENRSGRNGLEEGVIFWRDLRVARKTQKKIEIKSVGYVYPHSDENPVKKERQRGEMREVMGV